MTLETSHPHVLFFSCPGCPVQKPVLRTQDLHMTCVPAVHSYLFEHVNDCEKYKKIEIFKRVIIFTVLKLPG